MALSRVDHILFAFFVFAVMLFQQRRDLPGFIRNGLCAGLPVLALFGGYLCLNKLVFGVFLPISGLVKDSYEASWLRGGWPHGGFWGNIEFHIRYVLDLALGSNIHTLDGALFRQHDLALPEHVSLDALKGTLYGLCALGFLFGFYKIWKRELTPYYLAFAAFAICHLLLYASRLPHFTLYGTWYFTIQFLLIPLSLFLGLEAGARFLAWLVGRARFWLDLPAPAKPALGLRPYALFAVCFCAATFLIALDAVRDFSLQDPRTNRFHRAALWINENLPAHATIGAHSAGTLAYFVENRAVINLDGLINSADYLRVMQEGRFADYALSKIDYYADYSTQDLEQTGICWTGSCVPPENLSLAAKWPITETQTYYILKLHP